MVPDHVDHRRPGPARIVDICPAIQVTRAKVQQGHRRTAGHPRMAVRRSRRNALEQAKDRMYPRFVVERGHEMHFRRARVGEAGRDAMIGKR